MELFCCGEHYVWLHGYQLKNVSIITMKFTQLMEKEEIVNRIPISIGYKVGANGLEIFSSSGIEATVFQTTTTCSWKFGGDEFFQINYSKE